MPFAVFPAIAALAAGQPAQSLHCSMSPPRPVAIEPTKGLSIVRTVRNGQELRYYGFYGAVSFVVVKVNCDSQITQIVTLMPPATQDVETAPLRRLQAIFGAADHVLTPAETKTLYRQGALKIDAPPLTVSYAVSGSSVLSMLSLTMERDG